MSAMTRDEIVNLAIKQAGSDPGLVTTARVWLDNILDRLYEDHKWEFQRKSASGQLAQGQQSVDLPDDYSDVWNRYGLRLEDSDGKIIALKIRDEDYLDLISDPNVEGQPEVAIVDLAEMTWQPYPLPAKSYTWRLRYKHKPERLATVEPDPRPLFPNDQLLVEAVYTMVLQFEDDDRAPGDLSFLESLIRKYKHGFNKSLTKRDRMELNPEVFKPITNLR